MPKKLARDSCDKCAKVAKPVVILPPTISMDVFLRAFLRHFFQEIIFSTTNETTKKIGITLAYYAACLAICLLKIYCRIYTTTKVTTSMNDKTTVKVYTCSRRSLMTFQTFAHRCQVLGKTGFTSLCKIKLKKSISKLK